MRTVLLAEDSPSDVKLFQLACADLSVPEAGSRWCRTVRRRWTISHQRGEFEGVDLPRLVILDLNMPRVGGCDMLA